MPLDISTDAIIEKNKISSSGTWLLLLEVLYPNEDPVYLCLNNEQIIWNGNTWLPAIFSLTGMTETKDAEIPSIPLTVIDINRSLIPALEKFNGGIGATVIIRVVHSNYLSNTVPELEEYTEVMDATVDDSAKISFKLGAENLSNRACPSGRFLKNYCRFVFKGTDGRCGYSGLETSCNRTLARCKELGNSTRYGGFPGVGTVGIMV